MGEEHREDFGAFWGPDELTIYKNTFTEMAAEEFAKNELASEQLTSKQLVEKAAWTVLYVSRLFGLRCSAQSCLMGDQRMYMLRASCIGSGCTAHPIRWF